MTKPNPHHPPPGTLLCAPGDAQERFWLLWYDDQSIAPKAFAGHGAELCARSAWADASQSWNCHLLATVPWLPEDPRHSEQRKELERLVDKLLDGVNGRAPDDRIDIRAQDFAVLLGLAKQALADPLSTQIRQDLTTAKILGEAIGLYEAASVAEGMMDLHTAGGSRDAVREVAARLEELAIQKGIEGGVGPAEPGA